jgi:flagellar motor switch protein FliN/FliY
MDMHAKKKAANFFATAFAESLAQSLAEETGSPCPLGVISSPDPPIDKGKPVQFRLTAEGAISGECFVEFYEPQASDLVSKILKQPVAELSDEHCETLAKTISTSTTGLAASLLAKYGSLSFKVDRVAGLAFGGMFVVPLAVSEDPSNGQVLLYFGAQLLDALSATQDETQTSEAEELKVSTTNLKLVMDVELNVSLRFGQRQLPLREVLELTNGSVVELDRMVDEPVELYLDGKLIARGEAVVVDGNYGLRVTEIPQPVASHLVH